MEIFLKAMRIRLERLRQEEWEMLQTDDRYKSYNCQIVHYTRRNPSNGKISKNFQYVRTICPWDETRSNSSWVKINKNLLTIDELSRSVTTVPRLINNEKGDNLEEILKKDPKEDNDAD
jgi:hypothetical protein